MRTHDSHIYWVIASLVFILALFGDATHAFYHYDTAGRIPFFVNAVFGTDPVTKLLTGALFALLIAGCEVSE